MKYTASLLLVLSLLHLAASFVPAFVTTSVRGRCLTTPNQARASSDDDGNDNAELDSLRAMLESSWSSESMGKVPSSAESAAQEAVTAIESASKQGKDIFFVNLLLPAYDITQGENLYDEIVAVEYCIELAKCMESKALILVRDGKTVRLVDRVLSRKQNVDDETTVDTSTSEEDDDSDTSEAEEETMPVIPVADAETDSFRKQLMAGWVSDDEVTETNTPLSSLPPKPSLPQGYRLSSLFGDSTISAGKEMIMDVLKSVQANALANDDEETIIVLSAISREEMVALRSIAGKYKGKKKIILVNCHMFPIPKELSSGETVYSLMPLLAQATVSELNIFGDKKAAEEAPAPKVVIMRRYPRDWEVYVDVGSGFEFADSKAAGTVPAIGPPMDWVAGSVKRFMQAKA